MSVSYQALLGETAIDADSIVVQELVAEKAIIANLDVTKNFYVEGLTELDDAVINKLSIPTGAADGSILTSDATGFATWKPNVHDGDITGSASATVQHHKWIGNWDVATPYQKFNRVTHNHVEYRALFDNVGAVPDTEIGSYSLYNQNYPAPEPSTLAPDSLHQEIALRFEPNQRGFFTHFKFYNISLDTVDIKIYASPGWSVVHEQTSAVGLGWQTIELTSPVPVLPRQSILAAMRTNGQPYAYIPQDFDVLLDMDPAVYIGNDVTSTETVFWHAKPGHPSSPGNPPFNGGVFNKVYLIDVVYEVGRTWEVVLSYRQDTVFEEKAQPLHNKTDVDVVDLTIHNQIVYPIAADAGKVLTCIDNTGACKWDYPTQTSSVTMTGDVTGQSNDSQVNTLAGGTIQVADLVLENKAQPLRNKTDADIIDLIVHNSLKLKVSTIPSGTYTLRYLVGFMNPDFNDCAWINDLYAPIISAQSQLLYPVNAGAGKILSCVDGTGLAQWIAPPSQTMSGDVTGTTSASVVNTLAGGTIPVNQLVTLNGTQTLTRKILNDPLNTIFANGLRGGNGWAIPLSGSGPTTNQVLSFNGSFGTWTTPTFPTLGGDVTGTYGATTVNTLAGGTIPVNQLVTLNGEQVMTNKGLAGTIIFSDATLTKTFRIMFGNVSPNTTTMLIPTSTASLRQLYLPDATDMLMGKDTTDVMKNKTITDASNTVYANGIHYPPTWTANFAGDAPTTNQVMRFDGTNAVWSSVSPLVSLAGDASGLATNNVVSKATNDFTVGRLLNCKFGIQTKKFVLHEGGSSSSVNDHDFQGFGTSSGTLRYHVNALTSAHVFYAASSYTTSNELARITGGGDLTVTRTISASNGDRIKKIVLYEGGTSWDSTDHRYNGLGTSSSTLRYQVNAVGDNHVFYAATSATASNTLFAIGGDGRTTARMLNVDTWREPNIQGAWMGWNKDNGSGRTFFVNQMGLGYGGWAWINYNNSNVQTPSGNPSMTLDRDGNLTVRGRVISQGVPDAFSGNWWSADDNVMVITLPLHSSGQFYNTRSSITSINFSAWTNDANAIFLPVAGYFRISYRFKLSALEKNNIMVKCNVSVGGTNHPSLYTFDMGFTYQHDLHCEAIVNISAPNMWVSYPKITVMNSSIVTTAKDFELFTGHFTIEKMK